MESLPINMNWVAFKDFASKKFEWFGSTIDDFYPDMFKGEKNTGYRRIDHLLSDMEIDESGKITLNIQDGDPFIEEVSIYTSTLNGLIRSKYDCFFSINRVDYV